MRVIKRNGREVAWRAGTISQAVAGAMKDAAYEGIFTPETVEDIVTRSCTLKEKPSWAVEELQDAVESMLVRLGLPRVAKEYIDFRYRKARFRAIRDYVSRDDWRIHENANEQVSFTSLSSFILGEVYRDYVMNVNLTTKENKAHKDGAIHIHDLKCGFLIPYCSGWPLKLLLSTGIPEGSWSTGANPAKHLMSAVSHITNFIIIASNEFAGAQAFNSVDTLLAPFVRKDKMYLREVKQAMQLLVFTLNYATRYHGSQSPFSNLTFDLTVPPDMKDEPAVVGGEPQDFTYGDCQAEMDMINEAFLEVLLEGGGGETPHTFPIPTYNITNDLTNGGVNPDVLRLLQKATAKYGYPYYQNMIGSGLDPADTRAMCCRLSLSNEAIKKHTGGLFGAGDMTGSIGVVTLNLAYITCEAKDHLDKHPSADLINTYYQVLDHYTAMARDVLEKKRAEVDNNYESGFLPFTRYYLGKRGFKTYFSTIGVIGGHEACLNLYGHDMGIDTEPGARLMAATLDRLGERCDRYQEETGNLYNLESSPAESAAYSLALKTKKKWGPHVQLSGTRDVPYLTNSTNLPVCDGDLWEGVKHQEELQAKYTGGTVFHVFAGEKQADPDAVWELVLSICQQSKLPYVSFTPTFSVCPTHGYLAGEHDVCPTCHVAMDVYSRVTGYIRPVRRWNPGKKSEFGERALYI